MRPFDPAKNNRKRVGDDRESAVYSTLSRREFVSEIPAFPQKAVKEDKYINSSVVVRIYQQCGEGKVYSGDKGLSASVRVTTW